MGSANVDFCSQKLDARTAYIVGLWCADGYHRTSSIGISNVDTDLVEKFKEFFLGLFPQERIKLRTYLPDTIRRRQTAYHLYVNSRPLLRQFREIRGSIASHLPQNAVPAYLAGRFDGDGSVGKDFYRDCRIVYGSREEALIDSNLARHVGIEKVKVYEYRTAKTFCLYISRFETNKFLSLIHPYSVRLQKSTFAPRRDLAVAQS